MMLCSQEKFANDKLAEFSRPVESIMRCEDFKSNFARRLSNRYIGRSPSLKQQLPSLKLRPVDNKSEATTENVQPKIIPCSPIPEISNLGQNVEVTKCPDKAAAKQEEIKSAEVTALNMEVETLKWQLSQTEANRQMHLALLKQIVSFLNRVKEHMECQKIEKPKKELSSRIMTGSFSTADLPRSRSVLHFNKHLEYSLSPVKKLNTRKMSKSITNVNGFEDSNALWNQSKLSLNQEADSGQKITEEISRLITLANTVISTNIPDLSCSCVKAASDVKNYKQSKPDETIQSDNTTQSNNNSCLDLIEEDGAKVAIQNRGGNDANDFHVINNSIELDDRRLSNNSTSPSIISCKLEEDFSNVKLNEKELCPIIPKSINGASQKSRTEKAKEFNHVSNFIEDESGFSSMSSFQEIGIPIINIIPPTPCKEVVFPGDLSILNDVEDWKAGPLEIDKQAVKVFWV